jgi:acyl dehydratase
MTASQNDSISEWHRNLAANGRSLRITARETHPILSSVGKGLSVPVRVIKGLEELRTLVGQQIGVSDWVAISQERIDAFARSTGDQQWIHCDPERAQRESPFGITIAHGFLTLSLAPVLAQQAFHVEGVKFVLNYGLNRVRFPNAVKAGLRVRIITHLLELKDVLGGVQATYKMTIEMEGESKPACVAELVMRMYFDDDPLSAMKRARAARGRESIS